MREAAGGSKTSPCRPPTSPLSFHSSVSEEREMPMADGAERGLTPIVEVAGSAEGRFP